MEEERVDLAAMEAFLTLAEELHFGRTADRLLITQPRVSQLIRSLERRVGGRLFERTSRRVSLTPLGVRLRDRARPAYAELREAVTEARRSARGLRIGFLGAYSEALSPVLAAYRGPVELAEIHWGDLFGPLRRGEVDVQVTLWPVEQPDLAAVTVPGESARVLAIARAHPLARRESVSLEDLAGLPIVQPHAGVPAELRATFWPPATTPSGRPIPPGPVAASHHEMLAHVADGRCGFVTCTTLVEHYGHPRVTYVPVTGMPPARAALCWLRSAENERIREFALLAGVGDRAVRP
ncbi:LysR family transcriptional regulator [Nonomuraea sediminis]|uniref:LysR family transcriptional regulator n=1 Tax=Nonomuraea sediminis TaxID=2835864 RepID=UPI001BDCC2F6|nr:LysR family transcriptional regulator [Nonomuraea sediminis]